MDIKEVKNKLGITNKDIANMFNYSDMNSYNNSSRKPNVEKGIVAIYEKTIQKIKECLG